uniref:C2H2-type domain-containing protein n=1 Tax=Eptatretus burgeri TaxID=7764 RepID=A0A8C4R5J6_EPTBU
MHPGKREMGRGSREMGRGSREKGKAGVMCHNPLTSCAGSVELASTVLMMVWCLDSSWSLLTFAYALPSPCALVIHSQHDLEVWFCQVYEVKRGSGIFSRRSQGTSVCCPSNPSHRPSSSDAPSDSLDYVIAAAAIAVTSGGLTPSGVNTRLNSDSGSSRTGGALSVNIVLSSSTPPPLLGCKEEAGSLGGDEEVQHVSATPKEKRYKCADCGKLFRQSTDLFRHQSLHTGERPFQCVQCGKAFALARDLTRHGRTHTLERPYSCQRCGKTFRLPEDHQRIHTDKKPFQCDTCGKAFLRSHELLSHQRVHTGERPYRCDKCGKNFRWSHSLVGHQRTHSADRAFACRHCGKAYKHRASLALHQKSHMMSGASASPIVHEIGAGTITAVSSLVPERSPSSGECSPEFVCSGEQILLICSFLFLSLCVVNISLVWPY